MITHEIDHFGAGYYVNEQIDSIMATGEGTLVYQWQYQYPNNGIWETMATGTSISIIPRDAFKGYSEYWENWEKGGAATIINVPVRTKITNSF